MKRLLAFLILLASASFAFVSCSGDSSNNGWFSDDITMANTTNRTDFRKETIYFLMPTRFYDGESSTNVHCWDDATAKNPDSDPAWRGDFKGLIEKLDYIKALGFTAIWITPPVKNASGYDYHGYHAINMKEIDPRYKTSDVTSAKEAYQKFIDAAHAKGLKVIQDVVFNHSGNFGEENIYPLFKRNAPTGLNDTITASLVKNDVNGVLPSNYDSLTATAQYDARIAAMKEDAKDVNKVYHHEKSLSWESYTVQTGQIAGDCVDLNTENPTVYNYLVEVGKMYMDMGIDAYRVDTVKHISRLTFNKAIVPPLKTYGGDNFYIFGEVCSRYRQVWNNGIPAISAPFYTWKESKTYSWGDRATNEASVLLNWNDNCTTTGQPTSNNAYLVNNAYHTPDWTMRSGMDVIDFPMHWNFCNARDAFSVAVNNDSVYNDPTWNVTYVDSHDYAPDTAPENQRFNQSTETWAENLDLMFTFRGIPCIFYGSEIEFMKGAPIDVGPNAPLSTTGRAYFGDKITGSVTVSDFAQWSNASGNMATTLAYPLSKHIQRLNLIRRAVPALQMGQYTTSGVSGDGMAFKRRYTSGTTDSFACVTISGSATFSGIPNGTYKDAITGDSVSVTGGSLSASCSGKGNMRIYVLNGTGKIGSDTSWLYGSGGGGGGTTTTFKVHFKVNSYANWSTVYCYYWGGNGSPTANSWPGATMTSEGSSWYVYDVPGTSASVIFNNNSSQTVDLSRSGEGWFVPSGTSSGKITGTWYSSNPDDSTGTAPSAPTGLTVGSATSSSLTVSWTASSGATSYTVYRASTSGGTFSSVGTSTGTSFSNSGLSASTTYYYKVTATNSYGTSGYSSEASGTTSGTGTATTTIKVTYDVGVGNSIYIRGSVSPLSWTTGATATWTTGNVWVYTTTAIPSGTAFEFKALINDSTWSDGANFTGTGGSTISVTPTFNGNFYDTMDSLNNWDVTGYSGSGKWHINNYMARAFGCTSESVMTTKFSMSKTGSKVTLAFKYTLTGLDSGEYLAADVYNGSTWTQVASYTGTKSATNVSIDVTAYQSANFKVRFRTKMSATNEYSYVDNVSVAVVK